MITDHQVRNLGRKLDKLIYKLSGDNAYALIVLTDEEIKFTSNLEDEEALKAVREFLQKSKGGVPHGTPAPRPPVVRPRHRAYRRGRFLRLVWPPAQD